MEKWFSLTVSWGALIAILVASTVGAQTEPSGTWLDGNTNWNQAGAALPPAPAQAGSQIPDCQQSVRTATLPEDASVAAAGWTLTGPAHVYGNTTVITGMANADGMCRPMVYQAFVFTDGEFAGTLSPLPMDSRTDGSLYDLNLYQEGASDAAFNRYQPEDALCCASGESRLFYKVDTTAESPLLVPQFPASTSTRSQNQ